MIAPEYRLRTLEPPMATAAAGMTFPAFRHMLDLAPTERFPGQPEQRPVQALGATAWQGETLAGLGLAEVPRASDWGPPEVLSVFVHPQHRNRGLATALLAELENRLGGLGFETLDAVYMTGKPGVPAIERILAKRGWTPPETRTVTLRFTPEEASKTPWYGRLSLPRQSQIFSWVDLPPGELEEIQRSHEEKPWIADGLEPWRHVAAGAGRGLGDQPSDRERHGALHVQLHAQGPVATRPDRPALHGVPRTAAGDGLPSVHVRDSGQVPRDGGLRQGALRPLGRLLRRNAGRLEEPRGQERHPG